jgi:hypothetical protein
MKIYSGFSLKFVSLLIVLSFVLANQSLAGMEMEHGSGAGHGMAMHHQHIMLNHALGMALAGSNLVMLGEMGMAKGVDKISVDHGKMMMKNGRDIWNKLMSGDTMMKMHAGGTTPSDDPMMKYTHQMSEAQLKVMDHEMLNHALKMALEGSNIIMLGQMGMAKGVDEISVEHGKMMMRHANSFFNEIMSGETMTGMHSEGTTPEKDKSMGYTHKLAEAQMKVMNLLKMMPSVM